VAFETIPTLVHYPINCRRKTNYILSHQNIDFTEKNKIKNFILSKRAITPSKWSDQYAWGYDCGV
jgi:hypothetical protein